MGSHEGADMFDELPSRPHTAMATVFDPHSHIAELIERRRAVKDYVASQNLPVVDEAKAELFRRSMADLSARRQLMRLLAKTLIFSETTDAFRSAVVDVLAPMEYKTGDAVFRSGEQGDWMGILISGRLAKKMERKDSQILIGEVGPGSIIGDLGLLGVSATRSFTLTAQAPCLLLLLAREDFEDAVVKAGGRRSMGIFQDAAQMQNVMQDTESFCALKCFKDLDRDFVMTLRENSEARLCYPNQVLMRENNFGDEMYILRAGSVRVEAGGKLVAELGAGVVVGELAVLGANKRRNATVTCTSLSLVRALHADVFHDILCKYPSAQRMFEHRYVARMVELDMITAQDEMRRMDRFHGSAMPMAKEEVYKLFGSSLNMKIEDRARKSARPAKQPSRYSPLPALQQRPVTR